VIRINAAPTTSQHDAAVGSRTTWRVHNSEKPYFLAAFGLPELQLLICHMGWIGSCQHQVYARTCSRLRAVRACVCDSVRACLLPYVAHSLCQAFSGAYTESTAYINPAFYSQLWAVLGRPADKQSPSTGLLAIALALGACDRVTLFGFGAAGAAGASKCRHYWECGAAAGSEASYYDPMHTFHDWLAEEVLRNRWIEAGLVTDGHAAFANASAAAGYRARPEAATASTAAATTAQEAQRAPAATTAARSYEPSAAEARAAVAALLRRDDVAARARWVAMQPEWQRERAALRAERQQRKRGAGARKGRAGAGKGRGGAGKGRGGAGKGRVGGGGTRVGGTGRGAGRARAGREVV